ncbi:MAG TPA: class D sortase [Candidatus Eisenbacteria bacterium]|nr:class D sortase [Candidatus Eisenbacteria bacterium]
MPAPRRRTPAWWLQSALLLAGALMLLTWTARWLEARAFQQRASRELDAYAATVAPAGTIADATVPEPAATAAHVDAAAHGDLQPDPVAQARPSRATLAAAHRTARTLARRAQAKPHARAAATRRLAHRSGIIGRVEVPRVGVRAVIAEGTSTRVLAHAVGHVRWTPLPGEPGNVGLTAHRDSYFHGLAGVRRGDLVRVVTPDGTWRYRVTRVQVVPPTRTDVLRQGRGSSLTLVTCWPFRWIGPAPRRFVVSATLDPSPTLRAAR